MADGKDDNKGSRSIRALEVIEALVDADRPVGVADLAQATGLPRASLHRIVNLLEDEGFMRQEPGGRGYIGGLRLDRLARKCLAANSEQAHRHAILAALSREVGETCNISMPDGDRMRYFDRVETEWPLRHQLPVGSRVPLHCTASGKLYLSQLPRRGRERLLATLPFEGYTSRTITDPAALDAALEALRAEQAGVDDQEFIDGMIAVAVPITDAKGRMVAALACHAPTVRLSLEDARGHLPALRKAAKAMSG